MRITTTLTVLLSLLLLTKTASALELTGSAVYTQLNRDYYLAGLYLPATSNDPNTIFSAATAKRMQLLMRMPTWSPRRWHEHWQNNIAINNEDNQADERLQQALLAFMQFPHADLIYNDEVIIDYQAHGNSRVLLNGEQVLEVPGTEFINQILKTWIGKLPPSREFRQHILSTDSITPARRDLLERHLRARTDLWSSWIAAEQAAQLRQQQEQERIAAAALVAEQQRLEREQAVAREQQRLAAAQQAQREREQAADSALSKAAQKIAREKAQLLVSAQQLSIDQQTQKLVAAGKGKEKIIEQQQRYYLDMLQWQLQRQVEALVEYPTWAKQFEQQGLIEVDFILQRNRATQQLQSRNPQSPALLNAEVKRAIKLAAEKTPIPDVLAGESWPLTVHYQFALSSPIQPKLEMPKAPSAVLKEARSHWKPELLVQYQAHIRDRIMQTVQYPLGAKTLSKQDSVALLLVLSPDGSIKTINDVKLSAHPEFNQALAEAIKHSQPFPPLPLALSEKEVRIEITYEFKL